MRSTNNRSRGFAANLNILLKQYMPIRPCPSVKMYAKMKESGPIEGMHRCNSQKYTYPQNYTPGIFSHTKISQKHTRGMFSHQAIRNG